MKKISLFVSKFVEQRPSSEAYIVENFDGLRAVAALMVMSMHIHTIPNLASGPPGVWIFFALSGFLLYSAFLNFTHEINSKTIFAYLARRVFRIVPLYLFFVTVYTYIFKGWPINEKNIFFLAHGLFINSNIHLWTVLAEMALYLVLPIIIISLSFFRTSVTRSLLLITGSILSVYLLQKHQVSLPYIKDYVAVFALGMAAVHLKEFLPSKYAPFVAYTSLGLILLLCTFVPWNKSFREFFGLYNGLNLYSHAFVFYPLSFLLLLSLSRFKSRFWGNQWLRLIGVCGFGFYLWHPLFIELTQRLEINGFFYQIVAYGLTLITSIFSYLVIEKPGIEIGRKVSKWIKENKIVFWVFRPWWICVIVLTIFFAYRHIYIIDKPMQFQVVIWSSENTTARVYVADANGRYTENIANGAPLKANQWQKISIPIRERKITKMRFDPGSVGGEYKIKEFGIKFPLVEQIFFLDIGSFVPFNDIKSITNQNTYLRIQTEAEAKDPILLFKGSIPNLPSKSIKNLLIIAGILGALSFIIIFSIIDRMAFSIKGK